MHIYVYELYMFAQATNCHDLTQTPGDYPGIIWETSIKTKTGELEKLTQHLLGIVVVACATKLIVFVYRFRMHNRSNSLWPHPRNVRVAMSG